MRDVVPFSRAAGSSIGDLEIETDEDSLVLSGTLTIGRDRKGLETARRLKDLLTAAVADLEKEDLPDRVPPARRGGTVPNPF